MRGVVQKKRYFYGQADLFCEFFGNFGQKRVKYAIKSVIYKSWAKFPTFTENLFGKLPLPDGTKVLMRDRDTTPP